MQPSGKVALEMDDVSWADVTKFVKKQIDDLAESIYPVLETVIKNALEARGISFEYPKERSLREVAYHAAKDLNKLAIYQDNNVDPIKIAGTICFWIRKIKPIRSAQDGASKAIDDINERLSIWLLSAITTRYMKKAGKYSSDIEQKFTKFLNEKSHFEYAVHCLRFRTFGPHHYIILGKTIALR